MSQSTSSYITVEDDDDETDDLTSRSRPLDDWFSDGELLKAHKETVEETVGKVAVSLPPEEQAARDQPAHQARA